MIGFGLGSGLEHSFPMIKKVIVQYCRKYDKGNNVLSSNGASVLHLVQAL